MPRCRQSYVTDNLSKRPAVNQGEMIPAVPFQIQLCCQPNMFQLMCLKVLHVFLEVKYMKSATNVLEKLGELWHLLKLQKGSTDDTPRDQGIKGCCRGVNWWHTNNKGCCRGTADRWLTWGYATIFSLGWWNVVQNCKICRDIIWWTVRHVNDILKSGKKEQCKCV